MNNEHRVLVFGLARQRLGGIETFLLNMNEHMSSNVIFDYVVLTGPEECIHTDRIEKRKGKVFYVTSYTKNAIRYFYELNHLVRKEKDTHRIAYINLFSMTHILPAIICYKNGYKIVLHSHNSNMHSRNIFYRLLHNINRQLFGSNKNFTKLTCSKKAADFMFGQGKNREATLVYNAIDTEKYCFNQSYRNEIRDNLKIDEGIKIVGFVGRIAYQKNPFFLIDIFCELCKMRDDCKLLIIGDGEYRAEIERKIGELNLYKDTIILNSQKDIEKYYSAMDIFLLPSLFEGLPVVIVETQAAGLKSVVSSEAVTKEACICDDFIDYISLSEKPIVWAQTINEDLNYIHNRNEWNNIVYQSDFNILVEARKLQKYLID